MTMPDYTLEQKAMAFDTLWETCGKGLPTSMRWKEYSSEDLSYIDGQATITRLPHYAFEIRFVGDCHEFADVLHYLATKKDNP